MQDQQAYIEKLEKTIEDQKHQIQNLNEIIRLLQKGKYYPSSEKTKVDDGSEQICMFNEAEYCAQPDAPKDETETVKEHTRKKNKTKRIAYIKDLPVKEILYDLKEEERQCPECGTALKTVCKETVREEVEYTPAKLTIIRYVREVAECPQCKHTDSPVFIKANTPTPLLNHSLASSSIVSQVMTQKYVNSLPLYRQEKIWDSLGLTLSRATMGNWVVRCAEEYLEPIFQRLREVLLSQDICHCDETPVQVLKEEGRKPTSKSYMWVFRNSEYRKEQIILYDYHPSRCGKNAAGFLDGFNGYIITDGYSAYNKVAHVIRCGCMAHLHRKFQEAIPPQKAEGRKTTAAETGLAYCNQLFSIEKKLKELTPEERYIKRLELEKPVLEAFWSWLNTIKPLKGSRLYKAVKYARNQKEVLENYLLDGRLPCHNNLCENALRNFCLGRRNWLFSDTPKGAKASATVYSLVETAKANGLDVYKYLKLLLASMPEIGKRYEIEPELLDDLMPWSEYARAQCQS